VLVVEMVFPVFTDFALDTAREIRAANLPHLATVESFSTSHQRGGGTVSDPVILAEGEPCCMRSPGATPQERAIADQLGATADARSGLPCGLSRGDRTARDRDGKRAGWGGWRAAVHHDSHRDRRGRAGRVRG
jgi:hypothetical protein